MSKPLDPETEVREPHRKNGLVLLGTVVAPELSPDKAARLREQLQDVDWPSLLAAARNQAVTPAVHTGLLAKGLAQVPPREVRAHLAVAHRLNRAAASASWPSSRRSYPL